MNHSLLSSVRDYSDELKPSMKRAPRLKKKQDILKSSHAIAGIHYETYKPDRDNADGYTRNNIDTASRKSDKGLGN